MSALGPQFADQEGLFPENHPAMRRLEPHEMTPDQWRARPDVYVHATYSEDGMPLTSTSEHAAGIHLGSEAAARERIDILGPKGLHTPQGRDRAQLHGEYDETPATMHYRRVNPDKINYMMGSPDRPMPDQGEHWPDTWATGDFYENMAEDIGSISIRVPNHSFLLTHAQDVRRAQAAGKKVHPVVKWLLETHGDSALNAPGEHSTVEAYKQKVQNSRGNKEPIRHDTLLPYKMLGKLNDKGYSNTVETMTSGGQTARVRNVTFAPTLEDAQDMMSPTLPPGKKWVAGFIDPKDDA